MRYEIYFYEYENKSDGSIFDVETERRSVSFFDVGCLGFSSNNISVTFILEKNFLSKIDVVSEPSVKEQDILHTVQKWFQKSGFNFLVVLIPIYEKEKKIYFQEKNSRFFLYFDCFVAKCFSDVEMMECEYEIISRVLFGERK